EVGFWCGTSVGCGSCRTVGRLTYTPRISNTYKSAALDPSQLTPPSIFDRCSASTAVVLYLFFSFLAALRMYWFPGKNGQRQPHKCADNKRLQYLAKYD